ncbi:hypothetical protein SAMN05421774_11057 [Gemmobacter megaterium]|uniref:SGNH/GDSL hydrolase family protein n=1 Tax=Gemmobacter megaterium TaxID=1086013 RepID=A0A1N7QFQ9_9RHOB|nr:hypothetical protein [Gemmobacter megaterium]GGE25635.1 hypothetical protein GCM10011345_34470 [Gemmobacter megaterium]SIT21741.1 hypothetical protein SAMN05421774_11057 [Gemmobacter megaterium]
MRSVLLTGDSHLGALRRGADLLEQEVDASRIVFWPLGAGGSARAPVHRFDPEAQTVTTIVPEWRNRSFSAGEIAGAAGKDALLVVSLPLHPTRLLRNHSWHAHAPWRFAQEAQIALSDRMIAAMIDADSRYALQLTRDLARVCPDCAVLEAPRPFSNARYLRRMPVEIALHLDTLYRAQVRAALEQAGIAVIAQPDSSVLPDGTTNLAFDNENPEDDHHANARYGALVLRQILTYADAGSG